MKIATLLKSSTALSMVALLALSACGGGGGDGPETGDMPPGDGDGMMPGDGDGDGDGDDMMPGDGDGDGMMPPSPQALANAVDLVANDSRQDANQEYIGGDWYRSHDIGNASQCRRHNDTQPR